MKEIYLGVLKKGGEQRTNQSGEKIFGLNLPHWRFEASPLFPHAKTTWERLYCTDGKHPTSIPVYVLGDEVSDIFIDNGFAEFSRWKKDSKGGFLQKRCDGEQIYQHLPKNSHRYSFEKIPCQRQTSGCQCVPSRKLIVYPADFWPLGLMGPVVLYSSKSKNDMAYITGALEQAKNQLKAFNRGLHGARFLLQKTQLTVPAPAFKRGGKEPIPGVRGEKTDYFVTMVLDPAWVQQLMREECDRQQKLGRSSPIMLLPQEYTTQKLLPGSTAPVMNTRASVLSRMGDEDYVTAAMPTIAEVMDGELLGDEEEAEFLPRNEDNTINYHRLVKFAREKLGLKADDLKTVLANTFPGRHTSELKEGHIQLAFSEMLIMWSAMQEVNGIAIFQGGMPEARRLFHRHKLNELTSELDKGDRWFQIVHEIVESKQQ